MSNETWSMKLTPMVPTSGAGAELDALLRQQLGIPPGAVWYEVRVAMGETITVTCCYRPNQPGAPA